MSKNGAPESRWLLGEHLALQLEVCLAHALGVRPSVWGIPRLALDPVEEVIRVSLGCRFALVV